MTAAPDLYFFNPTCEYAVGNGSPNWQANQLLQKMETDLDLLPMFFATSDDFVLVENKPNPQHLEKLRQLGIQIPRLLQKEEAFSKPGSLLQNLNSLKPWGWSPAAHKYLEPFKEFTSESFKKSPVFNWQAEYRDLYSKKYSLRILHRLLTEFPNIHFIEKEQTASVCTQKEDFEKLIGSWPNLMIKAPWSSSGRGLQTVTKTPIHEKVWEKMLGIVKEQGYALAEPLLNKKLDLALEFEIKNQKITFVGISNFTADSRGRYQGNHLNGLPASVDANVLEFAQSVPKMVIEPIIRVLETSEIAHSYEGYFGVDTLIFEDKSGKLKINPCLEINLRYNMGLLAIRLEQTLAPALKGMYKIWFEPARKYIEFKEEMEQKYPLIISGSHLESGFLSLTDPRTDSQFGAYLLV